MIDISFLYCHLYSLENYIVSIFGSQNDFSLDICCFEFILKADTGDVVNYEPICYV